jgi:hypothetical protein
MNKQQLVEKYGENVVAMAEEQHNILWGRFGPKYSFYNLNEEEQIGDCELLAKPEPIVLTFKTPDVLDQIEDEEDREKMERWVEYGEYVRIEFDLSTMKATVLENKV